MVEVQCFLHCALNSCITHSVLVVYLLLLALCTGAMYGFFLFSIFFLRLHAKAKKKIKRGKKQIIMEYNERRICRRLQFLYLFHSLARFSVWRNDNQIYLLLFLCIFFLLLCNRKLNSMLCEFGGYGDDDDDDEDDNNSSALATCN